MLSDEDKELVISVLQEKAARYAYQAENVTTGLPGDNGKAWALRFKERIDRIIEIIKNS